MHISGRYDEEYTGRASKSRLQIAIMAIVGSSVLVGGGIVAYNTQDHVGLSMPVDPPKVESQAAVQKKQMLVGKNVGVNGLKPF